VDLDRISEVKNCEFEARSCFWSDATAAASG
jgi:hypothetical protein